MGKLSQPTPAGPSIAVTDPAQYEEENVHRVYEQIASHFSQTRYKPWPLVTSFLSTLGPGSIGADLGCGNGKYLHLRSVLAPRQPEHESHVNETTTQNRSILTLGLDRSSNLIDIARHNLPSAGSQDSPEFDSKQRRGRPHNEVCVGDALQSGYRSRSLDFAMSIATIHHFATEQRRVEAVLELIRIIKPIRPTPSTASTTATRAFEDQPPSNDNRTTGEGPGRFMIYVWALEQRGESRRNFEAVADNGMGTSEPAGKDPGHPHAAHSPGAPERREQDLLVPWVSSTTDGTKERTPRRKTGRKPRAGLDAAAPRVGNPGGADEAGREVSEDAGDAATTLAEAPATSVVQRFYHVFREGELEHLVQQAADILNSKQQHLPAEQRVRVRQQGSGWERGNWWTVWRVEQGQPQGQ